MVQLVVRDGCNGLRVGSLFIGFHLPLLVIVPERSVQLILRKSGMTCSISLVTTWRNVTFEAGQHLKV